MSRLVITTGRRCGKRIWTLFAYALVNGWAVARTKGGHLRFTKPGRPIVHTSSTPSDWRAVRNAVAMLARADGYYVMEVDRA
jgi:predicted RNA binding protein YcfA (HicA-like mRNA interferase family)